MGAPGKDLSSDSVLYGRLAGRRTRLDAWRDRCLPDEANCGIRDRGLFGKLHGWVGTRDWSAYSTVLWAHQQLRFWKVADDDDKLYKRGKADTISAAWIRQFKYLNPVAAAEDELLPAVAAAAEDWYRQSPEVDLFLPEDQYQVQNPLVELKLPDGASRRAFGAHLMAVEKLTMMSNEDACIWKLAFLPDRRRSPRLVYFDARGRPWGSVALI